MTVKNTSHATDFISSQMEEAVKTYTVYDGSSRPSAFYVASVDAKNTEKCQVTYYAYDGASSRIVKSKESLANWNSTWDI